MTHACEPPDLWQAALAPALGALADRRPPMSLSPARCLVARGCTEGAKPCERVCAHGAVRVHGTGAVRPGPAIEKGACDRCGLCVRACPSGAIEDGDGDLRLAVAMRDRLGEVPEVVFRCDGFLPHPGAKPRAAAPAGDDALVVPCLGAVGVGLLALAAAWGAKSVRFDDSRCAGCARRPGLLLARRAAAQAERLLCAFEREVAFTFESRARPGSKRRRFAGPNRRRMLGYVLGGLVGQLVPKAALSAPSSAPRDRLMLKLAMQALGTPVDRLVPRGAAAVWALAPTGACDACGACAALCPTGALGFSETPTQATLSFEAVRCTGCELCLARCPRQALAFSEIANTGDLTRPAVVLVRAERRPCEACELPVPGHERFCADCRLKCALTAQFSRKRARSSPEAR
ncbi:MAG: 4Fe-4S dicluster domain-containing protein [Myxococcaceae bacterium]